MAFTYQNVSSEYLTKIEDKDAINFIRTWYGGISIFKDGLYKKRAIVVFDSKKLIGFIAYNKEQNQLESYGTWVSPNYRKLGIAKQLWELAIEKAKPKEIFVTVASEEGRILIESIEKKHTEIRFRCLFSF